jgi:peptide deformylase
MLTVLHEQQGMGLAAPQVGLDLSLAVVDTRRDSPLLLINPRITRRSKETEEYDDACLSLPGWQGTVRRPLRAWVQTQDHTGAWHEFCASGLTGRVVQHEIDHLEGRLYPERLVAGAPLQAADPASLARDAVAVLFEGSARRLPRSCDG